MAGQVHVVYNSKNKEWEVKLDGFAGVYCSGYSKEQTERIGRALSRDLKGEFSVHGKSGKIQRKDSHGKDSPKRKG